MTKVILSTLISNLSKTQDLERTEFIFWLKLIGDRNTMNNESVQSQT